MKTATAQVIKMPRARPGTSGYRWTPAQRKKFRATFARKKAARAKEEREARRALRVTRRAALDGKGARRPLAERIEDGKDALVASIGRDKKAAAGLSGDSAREQRLDAIVYLTHAYAAYASIPDEALLGLLALRRLQGRIK